MTVKLWLSIFISRFHPFPIRVYTQHIKSFLFMIFSIHRRIKKKD